MLGSLTKTRKKPVSRASASSFVPGIGDRDEVAGGVADAHRLLRALKEVAEEGVRFGRRPRLGGDDEQRLFDVETVVERLDLLRVGGVERRAACRIARRLAEGSARRMSGASELPPIPSTTTCSKRLAQARAKSHSSPLCACVCCAISTQPRACLMISTCSGAVDQGAASCAQSLRRKSSCASLSSAASAAPSARPARVPRAAARRCAAWPAFLGSPRASR